jgi:hypothetical protein
MAGVDAKVDGLLPSDSDLRGRVAVANAHLAYAPYRDRFADQRWRPLQEAARIHSARCGAKLGERPRRTASPVAT